MSNRVIEQAFHVKQTDVVLTVLSTVAPVEAVGVDIVDRGGCCSVPELKFVFGSSQIASVHIFFMYKVSSV